MGEHTPGPWRVSDEGFVMHTPTGAWKDARAVPVASGFQEDAWCGSEGTPETRANARLISAAPDLLEALIYTREALGNPIPIGKRHIARKIDAAIAKARGETS